MFLKTEVLWDVTVCRGVSSFQKGYLKKHWEPQTQWQAEHPTILAASVTKLWEPQVLQVMLSVILSTKWLFLLELKC